MLKTRFASACAFCLASGALWFSTIYSTAADSYSENPGKEGNGKHVIGPEYTLPSKSCIYVGMTGLAPEERFQNHKDGVKAARVVQRFGVRLMPELYEVYNPMPFEAAIEMERELAEDLRAQGYTVTGGH